MQLLPAVAASAAGPAGASVLAMVAAELASIVGSAAVAEAVPVSGLAVAVEAVGPAVDCGLVQCAMATSERPLPATSWTLSRSQPP